MDMTASTSTPTDGSDSFSTSLPCVREGDCCLPNAPEGKRAQTSMVGWWVAILLFILVLGVFTYLFLAKRDGSATMLENQRLKARLAELEASSKIQDKAPDQGKFVISNPDGKDQKNGER